MLGTYFYHEIIRKTVIGFGTLFNEIYIRHKDSDGDQASELLVPLAYGPIQKFLARIEQQPNLSNKQSLTLPRMSFEMTGISYDPTRKGSPIQTFKAINPSDNTKVTKVFMPVPYNLSFDLNIICKLNDDGLQIVEQILPFFQPAFNITIDLVSTIGEKRDIPIILNTINFKDDYEGDYSERRYLIYTLNFTAKTNLFGPVADSTDSLIKKVKVDFYSDTNITKAKREIRYTVTPRALKDYNEDNTTTLAEDINTKVTEFDVSDATALSANIYIRLGNENMKIRSVNGNAITVFRAVDETTLEDHTTGDSIDVINTIDRDLIQQDDDFGFTTEIDFFNDGGKTYSPSTGTDY
jgi:hypothetical protein